MKSKEVGNERWEGGFITIQSSTSPHALFMRSYTLKNPGIQLTGSILAHNLRITILAIVRFLWNINVNSNMVFNFRLILEKLDCRNSQKLQKHHLAAIFGPFRIKFNRSEFSSKIEHLGSIFLEKSYIYAKKNKKKQQKN